MRHSGTATWIGLPVVLGSQNQSQTVSVSKPLDHKTDRGMLAAFWHSHLDRTSSCAGISEPITNSGREQTSRSQD